MAIEFECIQVFEMDFFVIIVDLLVTAMGLQETVIIRIKNKKTIVKNR